MDQIERILNNISVLLKEGVFQGKLSQAVAESQAFIGTMIKQHKEKTSEQAVDGNRDGASVERVASGEAKAGGRKSDRGKTKPA